MTTVSHFISHFIPKHYTLSLNLERTDRQISGTVTMEGTLQPGFDTIGLHAKDLTIESVLIDGKTANYNLQGDELMLSQNGLQPGEHIVVLGYHGTITDGMHGVYPCYYTHNGAKKELLATQFESHYAREAFPCIDEPEAKATFDVTLTTEPDIIVLGNMPVASQKTEANHLVTTFQQTPRMSTYLLAWVTGELHNQTTKTKDGVEVNVWATPAQSKASMTWALEIAKQSIEFYNDYFGVDYPLPKSDHVALPDFSAGAMENWGLITYREVALLADPKTSGLSTRQYVATVVAHELAHQWFGDLVTMKWWNNLWLNESFANLMEYFATDHLHPEWNMWLQHSASETMLALRRDSLDGVQPVQTEVHHPDEIGTLFDGAIVYAKGGRLLRMLQRYVGDKAFRAGLKTYFETFAYRNSEGNDLWQAIAKASGKDIVGLMNSWISQPGYPVVSISKQGHQLTLHQEQFFVGRHQPSNQLWPIPLGSDSADIPELLTDQTITITSTDLPRLNVGNTAHFITQYDDTLQQHCIDLLKTDRLNPIDRMQLLNEATLLARGGRISSAKLIPLLAAYENEDNDSVWETVLVALGELRKFVNDDELAEDGLRRLYHQLAQKQYKRLGWDKRPAEPEEDAKLRASMISMMLYAKDPQALAAAKQRFETTPLEDLDPELRPIIVGNIVKYGPTELVDKLLAIYQTTSSAELQQDLTSAITSTTSPANITFLLEKIKDANTIRPQDATYWYVYLVRSRYGQDLAWQWLQHNWDWVEKTFKGDMTYDSFPRYTASALKTKKQLQEYIKFFSPLQKDPALGRVITMGETEISGRVELIERDQAAVKQALRQL